MLGAKTVFPLNQRPRAVFYAPEDWRAIVSQSKNLPRPDIPQGKPLSNDRKKPNAFSGKSAPRRGPRRKPKSRPPTFLPSSRGAPGRGKTDPTGGELENHVPPARRFFVREKISRQKTAAFWNVLAFAGALGPYWEPPRIQGPARAFARRPGGSPNSRSNPTILQNTSRPDFSYSLKNLASTQQNVFRRFAMEGPLPFAGSRDAGQGKPFGPPGRPIVPAMGPKNSPKGRETLGSDFWAPDPWRRRAGPGPSRFPGGTISCNPIGPGTPSGKNWPAKPSIPR